MKPGTAIGIVLICVLLLGGCVQEPSDAKPTVKVGVLASLSGDAASVLKDSVDTIQAAVEEFNARPGAGARIELLVEDSKCNAKEGLTAAQKLLNVDRVAILLSDDCSGPTLAALPLADRAKTVLLASGATSPNLSGKSPYFFRVIPHDEVQGRQLAEKVLGMGFTRVAVLYVSNEYGTAFKDVLQKHLADKAVAMEAVADAETDFRTALTKIKAAGADAVIVVALTPQAPLILRQARELGLPPKTRFFGSEALKDPAVP